MVTTPALELFKKNTLKFHEFIFLWKKIDRITTNGIVAVIKLNQIELWNENKQCGWSICLILLLICTSWQLKFKLNSEENDLINVSSNQFKYVHLEIEILFDQ